MNSSNSDKTNTSRTYTVSKRSHIRKKIRLQRRSFSSKQQEQAASKLLSHILEQKDFRKASKIAFYQAFDGEIDPSPAINAALQLGKQCFLPVISPGNEAMAFVEFTLDSSLEKNHFGILEPTLYPDSALSPEHMDIIFMPLVAFDIYGSRLGMGKGYYDRNLAFMLVNDAKMSPSSIKKPKLIGLAHECQRVEQLERAEWDVPLDKVITDQTTYTAAP
ncbi:5-formyltetrahydrofolate cyclo-ligase [Gammaproteobacteria bacterium]|nr:5-formyltetrahydrofolate cyclo-ligase [Gammaproteobacteria bacterium]